MKMSYCKSCGAYMPDWAEECPACGEPKAESKKRAEKEKTSTGASGAASASASATAQADESTSGEYRYSYKKAGKTSDAESRWSDAGTGSKTRKGTGDKGAFRYDGSKRKDGGTFTYDNADAYENSGSRGRESYKSRRGTRDYEGEYRSDAKKNKLLGALCYFGPLFLLSWIIKPSSRFVRYHVNQGLVLFLLEVIVWMFDFIPFVGLLNILCIVGFFCGLSNALKGKRKPIPLIGEITLIN